MQKAYPNLGIQGVLRQQNEDFRVVEDLGLEPSGEGEHVMLWVEKNGANTEFVSKKIANYAGVSPRDVSFAGVKDRHAITQQWFSVWMKNKPEPDWLNIQNDEFRILKASRHSRKIKRGTLKGNHFIITVRDLVYDFDEQDLEKKLSERVALINKQGVPNYFGEQRFGRDNLAKALAWFKGEYKAKKSEKTWLLSSARSHIFNQIVQARIQSENWLKVLSDDVLMLDGTSSIFSNDNSEDNQRRFDEHDLHIAALLYGGGLIDKSESDLPREKLEYTILKDNEDYCKGLDEKGMRAERRAMRLIPKDLNIELNEGKAVFSFYLPSGAYATTLFSEIVDL